MTTKAYTISRLIREISALSLSQTRSVEALATALSPREGVNSVKVEALNQWLGGSLVGVVNGGAQWSRFGATSRTRVLRALRNRKAGGSIFG